jgi:hypothetical protein
VDTGRWTIYAICIVDAYSTLSKEVIALRINEKRRMIIAV